jgi:hypothetical protein
MAKRLSTTSAPAADIKTLADIPAQIHMTTGAGYVDCSNISLSAVKNLLNSPNYSLYDICRTDGTFVAGGEAGKINAWARYKPGTVSYNTGQTPANAWDAAPTFTYNKPDTARLGDFAGYRHDEDTTPVYGTFTPSSYTFYKGITGYDHEHVYSPFGKGYMLPILDASKETEDYWSRVRLHCAIKDSGGTTYSTFNFPAAAATYLTWGSQEIATPGAYGEDPDTYTFYAQPWYYDSGDATEAQCECGRKTFTYTVKPITGFLTDFSYSYILETNTGNGLTHDFGSGAVNAIYLDVNDIEITNNGLGQTPHYDDILTLEFRLKIVDINPGTGGSYAFGSAPEFIHELAIPGAGDTPKYVHWPDTSGKWLNVEGNIGAATEVELWLQVSDDAGSTFQDWQNMGTFTW